MTKRDVTISDAMYEQLQKAFAEFQVRAEKLSDAYAAMQEDFKRVNLELDRKNRELEESLVKQAQMRTYLKSILESMHSGVISVDLSGTITEFNKAAAEITGYRQSEVTGNTFDELFKEHSLSDKNVMGVLNSGVGFTRDEKVIWHKNGAPVQVSFQSAVLKDQNSRKLGAVEIFSDISRIKALEEEMQQNKTMAALGEMAATVVHEIRNPLGAMGVWASLLDRDLDKGDPRRETLHKIIDALARLNHIVTNLLVYSRPIKANFREVALQDILNETVNFIEIEAERSGKKIDVRKIMDETVPIRLPADPEKLQQLIMNLCLNAVQAMPDGGALTVSCSRSNGRNEKYACFTIVDTGIGIEKNNLDKIFDPFFTTKENGTGLGLAIVKKFVDHHAGFLDIKSRVHEGTTVRVFLPTISEKE